MSPTSYQTALPRDQFLIALYFSTAASRISPDQLRASAYEFHLAFIRRVPYYARFMPLMQTAETDTYFSLAFIRQYVTIIFSLLFGVVYLHRRVAMYLCFSVPYKESCYGQGQQQSEEGSQET